MSRRERKPDSSKQKRLLVVCAVALLLCGFGLAVVVPNSLESSAHRIIATCADAPHIPTCYEEEIQRVSNRGVSMEDAFQILSLVQEKAPEYFACHGLGHRLAAIEVAKDPSAWSEVTARCPVGICSNGCLHGAAQERFRADAPSADDLDASLPELKRACDGTVDAPFTPLQQRGCRHGIGHLALYLTNADIDAALAVCKAVTEGESAGHERTCYEGVFMQLSRPLEPEDEALSKDVRPRTPGEAYALCDRLTGAARSACDTETLAFMIWDGRIQTPDDIDAVCARGPSEWNDICHTDLTGSVAARLVYDWPALVSYCSDAKVDQQGQCFANIAFAALFSDQALVEETVEFCSVAAAFGQGDRCYRGLVFFSAFGYQLGSPESETLCGLLPEPWKTSCQAGEGTALQSVILSPTP